jgi:hypothetical protein
VRQVSRRTKANEEKNESKRKIKGSPPVRLMVPHHKTKNGSISYSTRSSASRDESSYRQSATTRTTRSGSGGDDITIKLHGGAVVEVGNTKISCIKGGEINIPRAGGGSDPGTVYDDDLKGRASRYERPVARRQSVDFVSTLRPRLPE